MEDIPAKLHSPGLERGLRAELEWQERSLDGGHVNERVLAEKIIQKFSFPIDAARVLDRENAQRFIIRMIKGAVCGALREVLAMNRTRQGSGRTSRRELFHRARTRFGPQSPVIRE